MQDIDGRGAFWRQSAQTAPFSGEAQAGRESSPHEYASNLDLRFLMARATLDIRPRVLQTAETVRYEFDLDYWGQFPGPRLCSTSSRANWRRRRPTTSMGSSALPFSTPWPKDDVHLHGSATSTMLLNLAEFQLAWSRWLPTVYRPVAIEVDSVIHNPQQGTSRAISAFSGGVDSSFTLLRNSIRSGNPGYPVDTVLLVHGFDVSLSNWGDLQELIERTAPIRELTGVQLRIVRTNSKELRLQKWADSFAAELAACMHLYSAEFSLALVGSSEPYDALALPVGIESRHGSSALGGTAEDRS